METEIRSIIAGQLNIDPSKLSDDAQLQDLVQDSIVLIGIVAELTEKLKLQIDPVKLNNVRTVGEAVNALAAMPNVSGKLNY